jgi:hypothetical protein
VLEGVEEELGCGRCPEYGAALEAEGGEKKGAVAGGSRRLGHRANQRTSAAKAGSVRGSARPG